MRKFIIQIVVHLLFLFSVLASQILHCWGNNNYGQLGNGNTGTSSNVPVSVVMNGVLLNKNIISISSGTYHTCVISSDFLVFCWGNNNYGQLGNGNTGTNSNVPVSVVMNGVLLNKNIISISSGTFHTCVISSDFLVFCWGNNNYGQLGNGNTGTSSNVPVSVVMNGVLLNKKIISISSGGGHTCVISSDFLVFCWGYNIVGELGNGNTANSNVPVSVVMNGVLLNKNIISISSGYDHNCVISSDFLVFCWGYNNYGELGNGNTGTNSNVPVSVVMNGVLLNKKIISISSGGGHTCVISSDFLVFCWGFGSDNALGSGSSSDSNIPVSVVMNGVLLNKKIISISCGVDQTCAFSSDFLVFCWGSGSYGGLGNGNTTNFNVPVQVYNNEKAVLLSSGLFFSCDYFEIYICNGIYSNDSNVCSSHGNCFNNTCNCHVEFAGNNCQYPICFGKNSIDPLVCSGGGNCTSPNNCSCKDGYIGSDCKYNCNDMQVILDLNQQLTNSLENNQILLNQTVQLNQNLNFANQNLNQTLQNLTNANNLNLELINNLNLANQNLNQTLQNLTEKNIENEQLLKSNQNLIQNLTQKNIENELLLNQTIQLNQNLNIANENLNRTLQNLDLTNKNLTQKNIENEKLLKSNQNLIDQLTQSKNDLEKSNQDLKNSKNQLQSTNTGLYAVISIVVVISIFVVIISFLTIILIIFIFFICSYFICCFCICFFSTISFGSCFLFCFRYKFKKYQKRVELEKKLLGEKSNLKIDMNKFIELKEDDFKIPLNEIKDIDQIGEGASATVFKGKYNKQLIALKLFKINSNIEDENSLSDFKKELSLISKLKHKNIIEFIGFVVEKDKFGIILEFCELGTLKSFLKKNKGKLSFKLKLKILIEISKGMEYLHFKKIIHRDLKPENILITKELISKITDFGISKIIKDENNITKTKKCGTSLYMAPEVVLTNNYSFKCDIFSFSIIIYQLLTEKIEENIYEIEEDENKIESENKKEQPHLPRRKNGKYLSERENEIEIEIELEEIKNEKEKEKEKQSSNFLSISNSNSFSSSKFFNSSFNIELKVANDPNFRPFISKKYYENEEYKEIIELIKKSWKHNPEERPNFNEISIILEEINEKII